MTDDDHNDHFDPDLEPNWPSYIEEPDHRGMWSHREWADWLDRRLDAQRSLFVGSAELALEELRDWHERKAVTPVSRGYEYTVTTLDGEPICNPMPSLEIARGYFEGRCKREAKAEEPRILELRRRWFTGSLVRIGSPSTFKAGPWETFNDGGAS
jgi:hypothetical protein